MIDYLRLGFCRTDNDLEMSDGVDGVGGSGDIGSCAPQHIDSVYTLHQHKPP